MFLELVAKWNYIAIYRRNTRTRTHIKRKESIIKLTHIHILDGISMQSCEKCDCVCHGIHWLLFHFERTKIWQIEKTKRIPISSIDTHTHTNVISLLANIKNPKIQNEIDDDWIKATHQDNRSDRQWQIEIVIQNEQAKRYCQIL